ncbi:MAG: chromate transporter [Bradyrhizobium sp.]|nr:chromate transporter [Bradyrhizobium sp.]
MSSESPSATTTHPDLLKARTDAPPGLMALFFVFAKMSLAGFGGVLPFARRAIVEEHRFMTADDFNETYALCHFLPGPNLVNLSFVFGSRFRGVLGALAAFAGLVGPPMVLLTVLAAFYAHYGEAAALRRTLAGVASAAVGLLAATVLRMMAPLFQRRDVAGVVLVVAVFVAIGLMRLPLQVVLLVAIPVSLGLTFLVGGRISA